VLKRKSWFKIVSCTVLCYASVVVAAGQFGDRGSKEIGGVVSFTSTTTENYSTTTFALSPTLNFFPAKSFMVGPIIEYASADAISAFGIGGRVGGVFSAGSGFIFFGTGYEHISSSGSSVGVNNIPVFLGYKAVVQQHIAINFQPQMNFESAQGHSATVFSFNIGVSGLLF
jgi:hypothetical protein